LTAASFSRLMVSGKRSATVFTFDGLSAAMP
jgi:hypothetical protein